MRTPGPTCFTGRVAIRLIHLRKQLNTCERSSCTNWRMCSRPKRALKSSRRRDCSNATCPPTCDGKSTDCCPNWCAGVKAMSLTDGILASAIDTLNESGGRAARSRITTSYALALQDRKLGRLKAEEFNL